MKRAVLFLLLCLPTGCRTVPRETDHTTPPKTTAEACHEIRAWFEKYNAYSVSPKDVTHFCAMRITADGWRSERLVRFMDQSGWRRDTAYSQGAVPTRWAWDTSATRCTVELVPLTGSGGVRGGIGMSGGGHLGPTFGVGVGVGTNYDDPVDYKIECRDQPR